MSRSRFGYDNDDRRGYTRETSTSALKFTLVSKQSANPTKFQVYVQYPATGTVQTTTVPGTIPLVTYCTVKSIGKQVKLQIDGRI